MGVTRGISSSTMVVWVIREFVVDYFSVRYTEESVCV